MRPRHPTPALIALLALPLACAGEADFTAAEHARLLPLAFTPSTPLLTSPTNRYANNPAAAALGQAFFFDVRFSGPIAVNSDVHHGALGSLGQVQRVACVSCHDLQQGGSDHRSMEEGLRPGAASLGTGWSERNAPSVFNGALQRWFFWDGRADSLWDQVTGPVEGPLEQNTSRLQVVQVLAGAYAADYSALFGAGSLDFVAALPAFSGGVAAAPPVWAGLSGAQQNAVNRAFVNFAKCIEAYERRLLSRGSAFDRYMVGERLERSDPATFSEAAVRGAKLFVGRASCDECHSGPALSDGGFHNHGVPQQGAFVRPNDWGRSLGIQLLQADAFNGAGIYSDDPQAGAAQLAGLAPQPADLGAMRTPTLRDVAKTAPYMHTGAFDTLWSVVDGYRRAANTDAFLGQRDAASVQPLALSDSEVDDLVAFLQSLSGAPLPAALVQCPASVPAAYCGGTL